MIGHLIQLADLRAAELALAEIIGADQTAVNEEIRIAADGGSEMRVMLEGQAEMPDIVRVVLRLRLGAENDFVDQESGWKVFSLFSGHD